MDEGWIRFLLESYEFPHVVLHDAEMRTGRLSERVDVIILPSVAGRSLRSGNREGSVPAEYTGGLGEEGVANLRAFVEAGGRLICNGRSSEFAISVFDLPVRNVMQEAQRAGFYSAGSLLRMDFDPTTPGTYGMPRNGTAFFGRDMLFEVDEDAQGVDVIARMSSDSLLLSGYVENDEAARGKITALAIPHGEGRTVLFGFSFHNRAQAHGTFKLLFNALSSVR